MCTATSIYGGEVLQCSSRKSGRGTSIGISVAVIEVY